MNGRQKSVPALVSTVVTDDHIWLRLTQPHYRDPFDTTFAEAKGGRWNPPQSWPTLYLNEDLATVHAQLRHMFADRGIDPDDLDDDAPIELAAATLPHRQRAADVVTADGVAAAGLPPSYPLDRDGRTIGHGVTQPIGVVAHDLGLRGVWCRSAAGQGRELAWFPSNRTAARPVWSAPLPFRRWRGSADLTEISVADEGTGSSPSRRRPEQR